MKRRMKKILISHPTGLEDIRFDDLDDGDNGTWSTGIIDPRVRHIKSLRRGAHNSASIHLRHFNKNPRGRGFSH
jgi:hypothetical protein